VDVVFRASSGPARSVVLNWTISTTPDILGYNVYRATTAGGAYRKLNTSPTPEASFVDNDVVPGQTYFYVTTAVDQTQTESTYSNEAVAFVPPP
jgi:fibronectin type 3 domain-containing protein